MLDGCTVVFEGTVRKYDREEEIALLERKVGRFSIRPFNREVQQTARYSLRSKSGYGGFYYRQSMEDTCFAATIS